MRFPSFCVLLDASSTSREADSWLPIPPRFTQLYATSFTVQSTIKGPDEEAWKVRVCGESLTTIGFRAGWNSFVIAYGLKSGDLIIVRLVDHSQFEAEIFGSTTSVGKLPGSFQLGCMANRTFQPQSPELCKRPRGRRVTTPATREMEMEVIQPKSKGARRRFSPSPKEKTFQSPHFVSRRRPVTQDERDRALELAEEFTSKNPFTVMVMRESHVYRGFWMGIKRDFARYHLPECTTAMILQDTNGNEWNAKWLGGRPNSGISGGWRRFALDKGLEEGDVCVFERLDVDDDPLPVVRVHIYRVVDFDESELGGIRHLYVVPPKNNNEDDEGEEDEEGDRPKKKRKKARC